MKAIHTGFGTGLDPWAIGNTEDRDMVCVRDSKTVVRFVEIMLSKVLLNYIRIISDWKNQRSKKKTWQLYWCPDNNLSTQRKRFKDRNQ